MLTACPTDPAEEGSEISRSRACIDVRDPDSPGCGLKASKALWLRSWTGDFTCHTPTNGGGLHAAYKPSQSSTNARPQDMKLASYNSDFEQYLPQRVYASKTDMSVIAASCDCCPAINSLHLLEGVEVSHFHPLNFSFLASQYSYGSRQSGSALHFACLPKIAA